MLNLYDTTWKAMSEEELGSCTTQNKLFVASGRKPQVFVEPGKLQFAAFEAE